MTSEKRGPQSWAYLMAPPAIQGYSTVVYFPGLPRSLSEVPKIPGGVGVDGQGYVLVEGWLTGAG